MYEETRLWYERLSDYFRLPRLAGPIVFGIFPIIALFPIGYAAAGIWGQLDLTRVQAIPLVAFTVLVVHRAAGYSRKIMLQWKAHAEGLLAGGEKISLREMFRLRGFLASYIVVITIVQSIFMTLVLPQDNTFAQNMLTSAPYFYWNLYIVTFLWMFAYSMYKLFRTARKEMSLLDFSVDRSLGLKPFGKVSLQLVGMYFAFNLVIALSQVTSVGVNPWALLLVLGLITMGLALFFVPQISLHGKLSRAKQEAFVWITPQYTELIDIVRKNAVRNTDEEVLAQLGAAEGIRKEIGQIHTWPFDVGIIARLSAIVLSVIAIVLSAVVRNFLHI